MKTRKIMKVAFLAVMVFVMAFGAIQLTSDTYAGPICSNVPQTYETCINHPDFGYFYNLVGDENTGCCCGNAIWRQYCNGGHTQCYCW